MSQLHAFVNVLLPTELNRVRKMRLIGKEKAVADYIFSYRHKEIADIAQICDSVEITATHYYKICSVVLDKMYAELVPEKGIPLLYFLNRKGLFSHFMHEIHMQEKGLLEANTTGLELEHFYFNCFNLLQRVAARDLDELMAIEIGNKYLQYKQEKHSHDLYFVRCSYLSTKLFLLKVTKKDIETGKSIFKELIEIEKIIKETTNHTALYQLNKALSVYYHHIVSEPEKVIQYLDKNLAIIKTHANYYSKEDEVLTQCRIAEMLYMKSSFAASFQSYSEIFNTHSNILASDFYHHAKYAQLAIILGKYEIAKEIIGNTFTPYIESKQSNIGTMGCLLFAKLYLFDDPDNVANKYIQTAKKFISKSFYIQYEFEVRILENIYFILKKEHKIAESLLRKNLKFMNSKGLNLKNSEIIYVFVLLQYALKTENKKLNNRLQNKLDLLQNSYAAIYGKLLNKVLMGLK